MSPRRPFSGTRTTRVAAVAAVAAALTLTGLSISPAESVPADNACPAAFPESDVVAGMPVDGLTVTSGTTPERFTGTTLGVLANGVGPGLDMIIVRLTSDEIDKAGIWEGMSGSPVYTADGRLLGAVAYTLAGGTTPVAGVTPAAAMQKLLTSQGGAGSPGGSAASVRLPAAMARRLVSSGTATSGEVGAGMQQLRLPLRISGLSTPTRVRQLSKALGVRDVEAAGTGTAPGNEVIPVVAGGNVAASISDGDVTTAGIGTATAVCGDEVLAFGHPMDLTGASRMSLHGARAIYIQEAPNDASFKVANLGAPVGTVDGDHRAGLHGILGPTPAVTVVTSHVSVDGSSRDGTTRISVPDAVPDIAVAHVVADQDAVLDGMGGGSGTFAWTIRMHAKDGTPLALHRTDAFADPQDISYGTVGGLSDVLYTLQASHLGVHIDAVTTRSTLSHHVSRYTLHSVQLWRHGAWRTMSAYGVTTLRPGSRAQLRVVLASPDLGRRLVRTSVRVPKHLAGRTGALEVVGGDTLAGPSSGGVTPGGSPDGPTDPYAGPNPAAMAAPSVGSVADVAQRLRHTPRHDAVLTQLAWVPARGHTVPRTGSRAVTGHVVDGSLMFRVVGGR
ncbi:MAG: hypothetical protein ACTHOK_15620 [Nocardioidaceae bacterium]